MAEAKLMPVSDAAAELEQLDLPPALPLRPWTGVLRSGQAAGEKEGLSV